MAAKPQALEDRMDSALEQLDKQPGVSVEKVDYSRGVASYYDADHGLRELPGSLRKSLASAYEKRADLFTQLGGAGYDSPEMRRSRTVSQLMGLRQAGYQPEFKSMGAFLQGLASYHQNPESASGREFRKRYDGSVESLRKSFMATFQSLTDSEQKAVSMNTFDGDSAGSLVLPEFAPAIMEQSWTNSLWEATDNYTVAGNTMKFPKSRDNDRRDGSRNAGVSHAWFGEEQPMTGSRAHVDRVTLELKKLGVVIFVTEELLSDSTYALEQWFSRKVYEEINFALGKAIVLGTGSTQPLGYLNSAAVVTVAAEDGQGVDILGVNILNMWRRRIAANEARYVWYVNQNVEAKLAQMQLGSAGDMQLVYVPAGGLSGSPYATLMGRPVIVTEFQPTLGQRGDIALVDLKGMATISKGGVTESVSPHVEFLRDLIAYKYTMRVDGRPFDDSPVIPFQGDPVNDSQSSFIVLEDRS